MTIDAIKQRFGIIGHSPLLLHAIDTAMQVAPTDISVLVTGESGTGKEVFPKIIHQLSARKHGQYIPVNCGAIPEGTIDSELFGHEKGSFTGAVDSRKGYFEVADGGTIFLDEVAELPVSTQVRLLRVLETGEFIKVGASKPIKTDVRIVAATNVNIADAIAKGRFREDLFYRLSTVPIGVPALRDREDDIPLLFRKFASDFANKYRMPTLRLTEDAREMLMQYPWPGNIRQLKNVAEQISIIEKHREVGPATLRHYLPDLGQSNLPVVRTSENQGGSSSDFSERDLMYKVLFDMKQDINELKKLVVDMVSNPDGNVSLSESNAQVVQKMYREIDPSSDTMAPAMTIQRKGSEPEHIEIEESLSLADREIDLIRKALAKHRNKRKGAAAELGISERTLYRKIKEHDIN